MRDDIYRRTTRDGVELLIDTMPEASGVSIGLWFPFGSAWESVEQCGLCHCMEHMFFKGAGDLSATDVSRAIDRMGGYLNAFTEHESVCIYCLVPAEYALQALHIILDMVYRPRLTEAEFQLEKAIITNEILSADDDVEEAALDEFWAGVHKGHAAARKVTGTVGDVIAHSFDALEALYADFFARSPIVVSAAGNIDAESFADTLSMYISGLGIKTAPPPSIPKVPSRLSRRMVKAKGSQTYFVSALCIESAVSDDEFWGLCAANSAYGESMSSRLFTRLREREGLCYSVYSDFTLSRLGCHWGVLASTTPEQFERFAESYIREAETLRQNGLSATEVEEAVARLRGIRLLSMNEPEYRMKRMARQHMFDGRVSSVAELLHKLRPEGDISCDAVNNLIYRYFDYAHESRLVYGKLNAKTLRAGAKTLDAVESEPYGNTA